jgi:hypothetical protein
MTPCSTALRPLRVRARALRALSDPEAASVAALKPEQE